MFSRAVQEVLWILLRDDDLEMKSFDGVAQGMGGGV
jgi:hypothetical protein